MQKSQEVKVKDNVLLIVFAILYCISLSQPMFNRTSDFSVRVGMWQQTGLEVLFSGWLDTFDGNFYWFANVFALVALISGFTRHYLGAAVFALFGMVFGLQSLTPISMFVGTTVSPASGVYVWEASLVCLFVHSSLHSARLILTRLHEAKVSAPARQPGNKPVPSPAHNNLLLLSAILYGVSLCTVGVVEKGGGWIGAQILAAGWSLIYEGMFAWYANLLALISFVTSYFFRQQRAGSWFASAAVLLGLQSFWFDPSSDSLGSFSLSHLGMGFYIWEASLICLVLHCFFNAGKDVARP